MEELSVERVSPRKMKFRRLTGAPLNAGPSDIIQKNLEPLKVNSIKKKLAQDYYYQKSGNTSNSPMVRPLGKPSVKQRLGRVPYHGTNSAMVPPKNFRRQNVTQNRVINRRMNPTQQRLYRIRDAQFGNGGRLRLNRTIANNPRPSNFKVEVPNGSFHMQNRVRRFRQILNHHVQNEIQNLQKNLPFREIFNNINITPISTKVTLHQRFAALF